MRATHTYTHTHTAVKSELVLGWTHTSRMFSGELTLEMLAIHRYTH